LISFPPPLRERNESDGNPSAGTSSHPGDLFGEPVFQGDSDIVQDGQVTDEGLAALSATALR